MENKKDIECYLSGLIRRLLFRTILVEPDFEFFFGFFIVYVLI